MIDRLIPRDEFPGACDAGVDDYILRRCTTDESDRELIRSGLAKLNLASLERLGRAFLDLNEPDQDALLSDIDSGSIPNIPPGFFNRMVDLAAEGFYSNPGNGGNRGEVSWKMIGYDRRTPEHPRAP